ncbi:MAG: PilZ domain-containing protein [Candidatus Omnitrophica bacterium]|nr:PilZ domain-containing protein [Candidatus Omnitrophota bacterium]
MEEKRKYVRLDTRLKITYTILKDRKNSSLSTETKDISGGGIRLFLAEPVPVQSLLKLTIHLPEDPQPIVAIGRVVWTEEFSILHSQQTEGKVLEAGIEFVEIEPKERDRIIKYVILGYAAVRKES